MTSLFAETPSIKEAVALIQKVSASKLSLILRRIVDKLHLPQEAVFTEEETSKLANSLKISRDDIELVLTTCKFFFSQAGHLWSLYTGDYFLVFILYSKVLCWYQAAYHNAKPTAFGKQLSAVGMDAERVTIFQEIWTELGKSVVSLLRKNSIATHQLETINWQLSLQIAQKSKAKQKTPRAVFDLGIRDTSTQSSDGMQIEFDHKELYQFFNQLDTIQSQLDSLS